MLSLSSQPSTQPVVHPAIPLLDHERRIAYQRSIQFVAWSSPLLEKLPSRLAVSDQLDRASNSVPLNIAEGNAKHTALDRCRYFDTARGSALECAACLDVLVANGKCAEEEIQAGKGLLHETVSLLVGLVRRIAPDRLGEGDGGVSHRCRTNRGARLSAGAGARERQAT
jgi:four helix bundle protein